jgi:hypothetical protein
MFASAIEVSRAWGSGLNRLGWGFISVLMLSWSVGIAAPDVLISESSYPTGASTLIGALVLVLASALLGSMTITLGRITETSPYTITKRTLLAERIGRLNNVLLMQLFGEASLRYEMVMGVRGTLIFAGLSFLNRLFTDSTAPDIDFSLQAPSAPVISGIVLAIIFETLLRRTSTEGFDALEKAIAVAERRLTPDVSESVRNEELGSGTS